MKNYGLHTLLVYTLSAMATLSASYVQQPYTAPIIINTQSTCSCCQPCCTTEIVMNYALETTMLDMIQHIAHEKGTSLSTLPTTAYPEFNGKKAKILSDLRSIMFYNGRNYVLKSELETQIHAELGAFLDAHSSCLLHIINSVTSFFSSPEVKSHELERTVLDQAYSFLGQTPDTVPARVISDFSDKIQISLARLRAIYPVTMDDIKRIISQEMQSIKDRITYKSETCPVCLCGFEPGQRTGILSCGHVYHKDCIYTWLNSHNCYGNKNNSCPVCRTCNVIVSKQETVPFTR